ncbi:MAG TPA: two-component regulator propeller domain-containing protein, partial [Acidobacteriaceae bacterium]
MVKSVLARLRKSQFLRTGLLFASLSLTAFAQARQSDTQVKLPIVDGTDLRFTHIPFGEGPSRDRISAIVEDNQGFLWFGTQDGLRRYDGYRTRDYRHDPKNPNSVSGNFINSVFKDHSGKIWIASNESLDLYDPATEIFTHYKGASFDQQVLDINEDHGGMMWLATDQELIRLDPAAGLTTRYQHIAGDSASLGSNHVSSTFEQKDGTFWVATAESLDIFDRKSGKVAQHIRLDARFPLQSAGPIRLYEDHLGVLWVTLPGITGLAVVDRRANKLIYYSSAETSSANPLLAGVRTVRGDEDGTLWLGTQSSGLMKLDRQRKMFVRYRNNPNDLDSLSADRVDSLHEDHEGGIWVGTTGGGVNRFARSPLPFQRYRLGGRNPLGKNMNTLSTAYEDSQGVLWIATLGSLERIDRKTGQSTSYRMAGGPGHTSNTFVTSIATFITSIAEDHSGHMWFGTYGGGLRRYDQKNQSFKVYRHDPADPGTLPQDFAPAMLVDRKGTLWVATMDGIAALDQSTDRFRTYRMTGESQSLYRALAEGPDGAIWLGTWDSGVRRFDPASGEFTVYRQDSGTPGSLSGNQVNSLCLDHLGILWVGTASGLNRFDPTAHIFTTYDERDGLPNSNVNGILEDGRGNLWVSTNNGLSRFDPRAAKFTNYSVADGLAGNEFYGTNAGFKSRTGEMFFCSRAGLTTFFPEKVVDNPYVPPVVLTDFLLFDSRVPVGGESPLKQSISVTNFLTLTHTQTVFSFEFSALSYANPQRNRYRYRLEGLDNKWNETDSSRRFVTYTTLAPREYVFRVQGSNNRGIWNENGASVRIRILPPWWSTWWFRASVVGLLLFLLWCAYHLRVRELRRQEKQLRDVINAVPANIWSISPDGAIDFVNQRWQELTGLAAEDARGWNWQAAVHPDDRAGFLAHWRSAVKNGKAMEHEVRVRRADGEYRWLFVRNVPLRGKVGKIVKWYGTSVDIDDRKRAEKALRETQAGLAQINRMSMMGELTASLAHEIKQPIAAAVSNAEACLQWLARDQPDLVEMREAAIEMVKEARRAAEIVTRTRSLFKKEEVSREVLDLNDVITDTVSLIREESDRRSIPVRTELDAQLPKISADRVQLQQVLMNLMLNGLEAMNGARGELIVRSQRDEEGRPLISVSDAGIGLPVEEQDKIFDAFFTTKPQGTG